MWLYLDVNMYLMVLWALNCNCYVNCFSPSNFHVLTLLPWLINIQAINEKFLSLNYDEYKAEIKSVDAQESLSSGVHVLVTGYMTGKDNIVRNFTQSFFLAPQQRGGYFVLNDMFRYVDKVSVPQGKNQVLSEEVEITITADQGN